MQFWKKKYGADIKKRKKNENKDERNVRKRRIDVKTKIKN